MSWACTNSERAVACSIAPLIREQLCAQCSESGSPLSLPVRMPDRCQCCKDAQQAPVIASAGAHLRHQGQPQHQGAAGEPAHLLAEGCPGQGHCRAPDGGGYWRDWLRCAGPAPPPTLLCLRPANSLALLLEFLCKMPDASFEAIAGHQVVTVLSNMGQGDLASWSFHTCSTARGGGVCSSRWEICTIRTVSLVIT